MSSTKIKYRELCECLWCGTNFDVFFSSHLSFLEFLSLYWTSVTMEPELETDFLMMRRSSLAGPSGEPLIVVEESGGIQEEEEDEEEKQESAPDSPLLNPYLLSPYRDMRKRSLPTPQCTSGITASQVRRLSEQGGEGGKGPSPMEAAFLATLSSAPAPSPGGRRHSVVTISRVPPSSLFGRNRRESIAAFGAGLPPRFPRKDSTPSLAGSSFNLQLDIMDDIAEIKAARKVKLKMWQTENEEKVCEVSEGGSVARYHQKESRRFSDVTGILPLREQSRRRASEVPPPAGQPNKQSGIVCSNNDLITIISSLTSSSQEINSPVEVEPPPPPPPVVPPPKIEKPKEDPPPPKPTPIDEKRQLMKNNRSNSFDVSLLPDGKSADPQRAGAGNWFLRRHIPMANKKEVQQAEKPKPLDRKSGSLKTSAEKEKEKRTKDKVVWDKPSGSVVDPQVIGSAIEVFLNQRTGDTPTQSMENLKKAGQKGPWFSGEPKESDEEVSCDNSICSTLKDLFVK